MSPTLQADSLPTEPQGKPKNSGVGSLSLLHPICLTQESNLGLMNCRQILHQLSYQGSQRSLEPVLKKLKIRRYSGHKDKHNCAIFPWGQQNHPKISGSKQLREHQGMEDSLVPLGALFYIWICTASDLIMIKIPVDQAHIRLSRFRINIRSVTNGRFMYGWR